MRRLCLVLVLLTAAFLPGPAGAEQPRVPIPPVLGDLLPPVPAAAQTPIPVQIEQIAACCKICRKGKACGNSCISRDKSCHRPPGCACDG
ncbi:MAG: hypothetical protein P1U88_07305 [Thalassobaculaceae bacterium]|nr:hypothetical protein [Thalassobaculaceae bacterium]